MGHVGGSEDECVAAPLFEQFSVVVELLSRRIEARLGRFERFGDGIADGSDLNAFDGLNVLNMLDTHHAGTDHAVAKGRIEGFGIHLNEKLAFPIIWGWDPDQGWLIC